jgi:hypothetical protein
LRGGLGHAPALADGEKNMQVPQPDAAPNLTLAVEFLSHAVNGTRHFRIFNLKLYAA